MIFKRRKSVNHLDCHQYVYEFILDDSRIEFLQGGNRDLYFACHSKNIMKEINVEINNSDFLLYNCIDKLYYEIINKCHTNDLLTECYYEELVNNNMISWESDDVASIEELNKGNKIYNYLNITKDNDNYILNFINNSNRNHFDISFNTDRSKYGVFVYPFIVLMRDLKEISDPYHQITIDEYSKIKKL